VLVDEGHAGSLVEAALRFPLGFDAVSTVLLGYSSQEQLETAASAVAKGPLSPTALARAEACWRGMARTHQHEWPAWVTSRAPAPPPSGSARGIGPGAAPSRPGARLPAGGAAGPGHHRRLVGRVRFHGLPGAVRRPRDRTVHAPRGWPGIARRAGQAARGRAA